VTKKRTNQDSIMIENMHDVPYLNRMVGPEVVAAMTLVGHEVKRVVGGQMPVGIQVLAGANKAALGVAKAANLQFIRAEGFVFSHVADEGLMNSDAGELLRYRKHIDADDVLVLTDIKKKHSAHAITHDVDIAETAKAAEFFLSDGVIVTGTSTGAAANPQELDAVLAKTKLPVLIGSGVTRDNLATYIKANALIVGSYFKSSGRWEDPVDVAVVSDFMAHVNALRAKSKL
jgi:membrane complex biogenesis BtpA family protein